MRLDLFLKSSRLILRRTIAQEFCDAGLVLVNGVKAKSSRDVRMNDEIEIKRSTKILKVRVIQIPAGKQVSRADSSNLYEVISETATDSSSISGLEEDNIMSPIA